MLSSELSTLYEEAEEETVESGADSSEGETNAHDADDETDASEGTGSTNAESDDACLCLSLDLNDFKRIHGNSRGDPASFQRD